MIANYNSLEILATANLSPCLKLLNVLKMLLMMADYKNCTTDFSIRSLDDKTILNPLLYVSCLSHRGKLFQNPLQNVEHCSLTNILCDPTHALEFE